MKNFFTSFLICLTPVFINASSNNARKDYIKEYSTIAIEQMMAFNIPASITLAQGILESGAGNSLLAQSSNNHFGIKCGGSWNGKTSFHDDDRKNECFRAYPEVIESYIDHSKFLTSNQRYASLFNFETEDYKSWANGLSKAGYATNPHYAKRLIQLIEEEELYQYDRMRKKMPIASNKSQGLIQIPASQVSINRSNVIASLKGETFYKISLKTGISLRQLHKYNAALGTMENITKGTPIYLQVKKRRAHFKKFIVLSSNSTLADVSQSEGVRIKSLMKINHISTPHQLLESGVKIFLR